MRGTLQIYDPILTSSHSRMPARIGFCDRKWKVEVERQFNSEREKEARL